MANPQNLFGAETTLETKAGAFQYFRLNRLAEMGIGHVDRLPFSMKVLLESCLRNADNFVVSEADGSGPGGDALGDEARRGRSAADQSARAG